MTLRVRPLALLSGLGIWAGRELWGGTKHWAEEQRQVQKSTYFMIPSPRSSRKGKFWFQKTERWLLREGAVGGEN